MIPEILFSIFNIAVLLTTVRYWKNIRTKKQKVYGDIIIQHTVKHPIIVQDQSKFSTYYHSIIGEMFRRTHLRESAHRLIDQCLDKGLIEITETKAIEPQTNDITLKITVFK